MNEVVAFLVFIILIHMAIGWLVERKKKRIEDLEFRFDELNRRVAKDRISQSEVDRELSEITKGCRKE